MIPEPEFDRDGYPTEATLDVIKKWPMENPDANVALIEYCQRAWSYPEYFRRGSRRSSRPTGRLVRTWHVSTGGWSGNESIIDAMMENWLFWATSWVSSRRGGHYEFETDA